LGLDALHCQSPDLIEKEVWMQVIAYNVVRALMLEAAKAHRVQVDQLSFKGSVDTLRQWTPLLPPQLFLLCAPPSASSFSHCSPWPAKLRR